MKKPRSKAARTAIKVAVAISAIFIAFLAAVPLFTVTVKLAELAFSSSSMLLVSVIFFTVLTVFVFLSLTKTVRLRLKMIRSLKKLCKKRSYKYGYDLKMSDSPLSPSWSDGRGQLVLETASKVYHVRIFAVRKYNSTLRFESATEMTVAQKPTLSGRSVAVYNFGGRNRALMTAASADQPTVSGRKRLSIDFSQVTDLPDKKTVKAVVICPTCAEWSYKKSGTTYVPTGNAESVFGYTVYTASGFVKEITRAEG